METKSKKTSKPTESVTLKPEPRLPILITLLGGGLFLLVHNLFLSILISVFGVFLLIQTFTLRLEFTSKDLVVWQLSRELRRFPFQKWLAWRLFLPGLPGLLYFREEASPHLLPILFDPKDLEKQLQLRVGELEIKKR